MTLLDYVEQESAGFDGHVGLAVQRLGAGQPVLFHAEDIFPTASVIKLVLLVEYFAQVAAGRLKPEQPVTVRAEDQVGGSGVLKDLRPGLRLTLHDLATLAITVSDNIAANLLIEQVGGLADLNRRLERLGMANTTFGRPFVFDSPADNSGAPLDFLDLLLRLARQQVIDPAASRQIVDLMSRQQFLEYIPRYLPYHPFAAEYGLPQPVTVANKVGMMPGVVNDAAIITTPSLTYVLVIFTKDCPDPTPDPDNEGALLVARLSKRVYDHFHSIEP